MEIYFDKQRVKMLKHLYRNQKRGVSLGTLQKQFGDTADTFVLICLFQELYIVFKDENGNFLNLNRTPWPTFKPSFRVFITPRGNAFLEERCYNFWRWIIPTLISIAALIISFFSLWS